MDWNIPISEEQKPIPGHRGAGGRWAIPSLLPHWTEAICWLFCQSPPSFPWKHAPGGPAGWKMLYLSSGTAVVVRLTSTCSHSYPGWHLAKLKLDCMSFCTRSPLYLRWAVALRLGLARELCCSWNNTDVIQPSLKSMGVLQLTHKTWSSAVLLNQFPQTSTHRHVYISTYK